MAERNMSTDQSSMATKVAEQNDTVPANELSKISSEPVYPSTKKTLAVMAGLFVTQFICSLDRLIVGVAIPRITDQFDSLGDVGWYGSAYLLTSCVFMLFMGKVYSLYNPKWIYLASLVVFEIGSAVSGAAPSSTAFIVGRAIAGLGNAGLFQGAVIIMVYVVPLHKRPQYMGLIGLVVGVSSALGPLIGGAFTDGPGWRWCFYINLPCGGAVLALLAVFLHIPEEMTKRQTTTLKEKIDRLDPFGTFCFLPCVICLLLALQWGGLTYNWSNARIIVLFILSAILLGAFIFIQRARGDRATVPGRIIFNRSMLAGIWFNFFNGGAMQVMFYYLPIWFQAIKGASAVHAGIMNLPMVLGLVLTSVFSGILTRKLGYYTQWMIVSSVLAPIGAGLVTTFTPHTGHSAWIGYQALFGIGLGFGMQQASLAAQTVLERKDVPIGASLMQFSQLLGGAIFISVGNNIFDNRLASNLAKITGLDVGSVVQTGATELRKMVDPSLLPQVLFAYNDALRALFYLATALVCLTIFGALAMEWKSVKQDQQKPGSSVGKDVEKKAEQV